MIDLGAIFGIGLDEMTAGHGLSTLLKLLLFMRGRGASGQDLEMGSVSLAGANGPSNGGGE